MDTIMLKQSLLYLIFVGNKVPFIILIGLTCHIFMSVHNQDFDPHMSWVFFSVQLIFKLSLHNYYSQKIQNNIERMQLL